ncbi:hypothetical protein LTR95_000929 [Oleoguttula sp. CCFEE 5521]
MAATNSTRVTEVNAAEPPLLTGVKSLFGNARYADFTVTCEGRKWKIHKAIVCTQNKWLAKDFEGQDDVRIRILVRKFFGAAIDLLQDAVKTSFNFEDCRPDVVNAMLSYMYNGDYSYDEETMREAKVEHHIQVAILAHHYSIEPLEAMACQKLQTILDRKWRDLEFVDAIQSVYDKEGTYYPGELSPVKAVVVGVARKHILDLIWKYEATADFHCVAERYPGFLLDILARQTVLVSSDSDYELVQCPYHSSCSSRGTVPLLLGRWSESDRIGLRCPGGKEQKLDDWLPYIVR